MFYLYVVIKDDGVQTVVVPAHLAVLLDTVISVMVAVCEAVTQTTV